RRAPIRRDTAVERLHRGAVLSGVASTPPAVRYPTCRLCAAGTHRDVVGDATHHQRLRIQRDVCLVGTVPRLDALAFGALIAICLRGRTPLLSRGMRAALICVAVALCVVASRYGGSIIV